MKAILGVEGLAPQSGAQVVKTWGPSESVGLQLGQHLALLDRTALCASFRPVESRSGLRIRLLVEEAYLVLLAENWCGELCR